MKRLGLLVFLPVVLFMACGSAPQTGAVESPPQTQNSSPAVNPAPAPSVPEAPKPEVRPEAKPEPKPEVKPEAKVEEKVFDPGTITQEKRETAKTEVQALIADLNRIIKAKNYNAWRGYLANSYFEEISSQAFLEERTEDLYRRDQIVAQNLGRDPRRVQKKILKTPQDYFNNVVVPSRSNDRMDDIDFVSENRVKAYTIDSRGQRLVLYDLEIIENKWKIIN